jgi:D-alanine-D-alanine ligase
VDTDKIISSVGLPAVVKPCSCGSSVGVYIVNTEKELTEALASASQHEQHVMVERKIEGRELTCALVDGRALPPVEIIPKCGFYDYVNKYQADATEEICPAPIGNEATAAVYEATSRGFEALRLRGYARFDYILDSDGKAWCLEANTLPGMTPTSLLPQEAAAVGIGYDELCEKLALMAVRSR